jgi:glutamate N-acetyltransferase/amino-acid N-acetyltransferase
VIGTRPVSARQIEGGVTAPAGFRAAGVACGIKRRAAGSASAPLDFALVAADEPVSAAAVFTTNKAVAAPIVVSREHLSKSGGRARVIAVNSGCANACTGEAGLHVARDMATAAAGALGCASEHVLIASTGVIGVQLDLARIRAGVAAASAALSIDGHDAATRAIMTTDPFPKSYAVVVDTPSGPVTVGGIAKGSGMIEPRMATMLAFLTTDARVEPGVLSQALRHVVDRSFNAITVDGECSTNDCVMLLANGASGIAIDNEASYQLFVAALTQVCHELALGIVRGGEGATKLVTVTVTGAASAEEARRAAKAIANSPLVKTAIHGGDPNWGRLIAVAGRANVAFELSRAAVTIGSIVLFRDGRPYDEAAPLAAEYLKKPDIEVGVDLGAGDAASTVWTCDLSEEYVQINADYRT